MGKHRKTGGERGKLEKHGKTKRIKEKQKNIEKQGEKGEKLEKHGKTKRIKEKHSKTGKQGKT